MTHPIDGGAVRAADFRPTPVRMRASDADRHAAVQVLQDAITRGLLTPAEGSERMAAAFAAVHRVDLEPLTVDLPPAPGAMGPSRPAGDLCEQLRSSLRSGAGRSRAAQVAAAVVLLVLLLTLGTAVMHLLLDGGPGPVRGGGFGRR